MCSTSHIGTMARSIPPRPRSQLKEIRGVHIQCGQDKILWTHWIYGTIYTPPVHSYHTVERLNVLHGTLMNGWKAPGLSHVEQRHLHWGVNFPADGRSVASDCAEEFQPLSCITMSAKNDSSIFSFLTALYSQTDSTLRIPIWREC